MTTNQRERPRPSAVLRYAGAFIAWMIGSGFATGQEILQFFTSYGYRSYAVAAVGLVGFLTLGVIVLTKGCDHKADPDFDHYRYYCGKTLGSVYGWIIPVTLILLMSVLISGSGATLHEYYGVNKTVGSALMAALVLVAYLIGFEKMVRIVSLIGPVIIVFSIAVGVATVFRDRAGFAAAADYSALLAQSQAAPNWPLSAALYLALNFLCGSTYYNALGRSAQRRCEAKWGAIVGAAAVVLTIAVMNTAILLNAENASSLSVPTLYLAQKLSPALGAVFSVVLLLGMFSSCSTMMWSFCSRFFPEGSGKNKVFSVAAAAVAFSLGLFPFSSLVSVIYPLIGYVGLIFIACVVYKGFKRD